MKTTIIQVETHDDRFSIKEKIEWCTSQRIILVFPKKLKKVPDVLGLRLIQRAATAKGSQVALVTRDRMLIENAEQVGVQVYPSVPLAQKSNWRSSSSNIEKNSIKSIDTILEERDLLAENLRTQELNPFLRIIVFLVALTALIALAVFILPTAQITVFPITETQSITLEISASSKAESVSLTGVIPASFRSFILTLEKSAPSSGTSTIGQSKAKGEFIVNNLTQNDFILPAGTIFSVNNETPIRFVSITDTNLSAGATSVVVAAEALLPGEEGNIEAGAVALVEGVYGTMVEAIAADRFTDGSSSILPAPTEEDYQKLQNEMLQELSNSALEHLGQLENEDEKAINQTLSLDKILSETRVNPIGEPSDSLTLELKVQYHALFYHPQDIVDLITMILDSNLQKGFHCAGNVSIETIKFVHSLDDETAVWQVKGTRLVVKNWDGNRIQTLIKGKTLTEAQAILNAEIPHTKSAIIRPQPKFWPRLPLLPSQIQIVEVISQ